MYYCMAPLSEDTVCVDWPSPRICWYGPWPFILLIKCVLETWEDQIVKRYIYGNASEDLAVTDGSDWCHEGIKKTTLCLLHNKRGHRQLQALSGSRSEGSSCQGQDWGRSRRAILARLQGDGCHGETTNNTAKAVNRICVLLIGMWNVFCECTWYNGLLTTAEVCLFQFLFNCSQTALLPATPLVELWRSPIDLLKEHSFVFNIQTLS